MENVLQSGSVKTEVYFSRKLTPSNAPIISFNNTAIAVCDSQKHLGLILDKKLAVDHHLKPTKALV